MAFLCCATVSAFCSLSIFMLPKTATFAEVHIFRVGPFCSTLFTRLGTRSCEAWRATSCANIDRPPLETKPAHIALILGVLLAVRWVIVLYFILTTCLVSRLPKMLVVYKSRSDAFLELCCGHGLS